MKWRPRVRPRTGEMSPMIPRLAPMAALLSWLAAASAFAGPAAPPTAASSDFATLDFSGKNAAPQWIVTLGAGVALTPEFLGSGSSHFSLMPSDFSIRRAGEPAGFGAPDDGFDFSIYDSGPFAVGVVGGLREGRSRKDDHRLVGLDKVPTALDAGLFAEYWPIEDHLRTRIELRQALWGGGGLNARLAADWVQTYGQFVLSGGPRASIGDGRYMRQNFSISAAESAANGTLPAYRAGAGLASVGANFAVRYNITPAMAVTIYDTYERLVGDAASSPITREVGSENQNTIGVNFSYAFGVAF
jgi:outer membrane scaffolding protein for murein synthesis (MipA/OmpV family)